MSTQTATRRTRKTTPETRVRARRGNASITTRKHPKTGADVSLRLRWLWPEHLRETLGGGTKGGGIPFDLDQMELAKLWKTRFDAHGIQVAWEMYLADEQRQLGLPKPTVPDPTVPRPRSAGELVTDHRGPETPEEWNARERTIEDLVTAYLRAGGTKGKAGDSHKEKELANAKRHIFGVAVTVTYDDGHQEHIPRLGDLPLALLTREIVLAWIDVLADTPLYKGTRRESKTETLGGKTIHDKHALLSSSIGWALIHRPDWISKNVARGIETPATVTLPKTILQPDQIVCLLNTIDQRYRDLLLVLVGTGMRWSEATALNVEDVVFLASGGAIITVNKAWKPTDKGWRRLAPKTPRAIREIPLKPGDLTVEALRRVSEGKKAKGMLFTSPKGCMLRNAEFHDAVWQPMKAKLLPGWNGRFPRIHDLRHTFATIMIHKGTSIADVSALLGHSKVSFTYDTYIHQIPGGKEDGMSHVNAWLVAALAGPVAEQQFSLEDELSDED